MIPGASSEVDESLSFVEGDSFGGIPEFSYEVDVDTPPTPNASVAVLQFRSDQNPDTAAVKTLTSPTGITIEDANAWTFSVPEQALTELKGGNTYYWGIKVTDANGGIVTILSGRIVVLPKVVI